MPDLHGRAQFAIGLKTTNTRALACAGIEHDERPLKRINRDAGGRFDAGKPEIDGALEVSPIKNHLKIELQHARHGHRFVPVILLATLEQYVATQNTAL
jgi:hypothetical protein